MTIKFITLNILHGGVMFDKIIAFLRQENPDVLFLQEVYNGSNKEYSPEYRTLQAIQDDLPEYNYRVFYPNFKDTVPGVGSIDSGSAIISRMPLMNSGQIFFYGKYREILDERNLGDWSKDPCSMISSEVSFGNEVFFLCNVHGIWGLDGGDSAARLKMSDTVVSHIRGHKNVILAGDFNLRPDTETIGTIENHLTNVFKGELTSTFNMRHKTNPGYATAVVDMLFVSPHIKVINHYCPQVDISDHLPLVAILEV